MDLHDMYYNKNAYDFRKDMDTVHQEGRRDFTLKPDLGEAEVTNEWNIVVADDATPFIRTVADDLTDYFKTSMGLAVEIMNVSQKPAKNIILESSCSKLNVKKSFIISCKDSSIRISGFDERGTAMGAYYLEDVMNLREAPFFKLCDSLKKEPLFSPRMIHSGYGVDVFTPNYLRRLAHHGFDAVTLYTSNEETINFNQAINDAAAAGLDVYFYSKFKNTMHPEDEGAEEFYDSNYGAIFRRYPKAKGIVVVGESCQFPSRDPNTTMSIDSKKTYGIPPAKPYPGWWPCCDFQHWISMVKKVIRKQSPDADVVVWTYNWGNAPADARLKLIDNLPQDLSLQATFEMYDNIRVGGTVERILDYSISSPGPGKYFQSEAAAAKRNNLRLYTMSNTGGRTWDVGAVPFIPAPFQWIKRHVALEQCRNDYSLSGLMESHHFGWTPSIISELGKWAFWSNSPDAETILTAIARRDFSEKTAPDIVEAWRAWSLAVENFITPIEDQYGPCRVGPSYPFIFSPDLLRTMYGKFMQFPCKSQIVFPWYRPVEDPDGLEIGIKRIQAEIKHLPTVLKHWQKGNDLIEKVIAMIPERKRENARKLLGVGKFMHNTIQTTLNIKKWWVANSKLLVEDNEKRSLELLDEMEHILRDEIENVKNTIPLVNADSRLGYEPSMDYVADEWHLQWKLKLVQNLLDYDIPKYRSAWKIH